MYTYQGKTALVTGASSGIGEQFAQQLAEKGVNLVLVARTEDKLKAMAAELATKYKVKTDYVVADLSKDEAAAQVYQTVTGRGIDIDMLVNNAGFASRGRFEEISTDRNHREVMLNVTALVDLTHYFVPQILERGGGAVINVASTAAFQPVPYMAVYGATKAFVLSFSEALWAEYNQRGLRVMALCPGATDTAFFSVAGEQAAMGSRATPASVVETALKSLEKNKSFVVTGFSNAATANLHRFFPRRTTATIVKRMMGRGLEKAPAASSQA